MCVSVPERITRYFFRRRAVGLSQNRRQVLRVILIFETVGEILRCETDLPERSGRRRRSRTVLLYWLCVSRRRTATGAPTASAAWSSSVYFMAFAHSSGERDVEVSESRPSGPPSAGLPGLIRRPPVWRVRMVGFFRSNDSSGWSRSMNRTSDRPKASTRSGEASASGRVEPRDRSHSVAVVAYAGQPAPFKIG